MGLCKGVSKAYLVVINSIFLIAGLTIAGASAYGLIRYNALSLGLPKQTLGVACGTGVAIFLLSLFGCVAAKNQNKCQLTLYILLTTAIVAAQFYAGVGILHYTNDLDEHQINIDKNLDKLMKCSYDLCCKPGTDEDCDDLNNWASSDVCKLFPSTFQAPSGQNCQSFSTFKSAMLQWLKTHEELLAKIILGLGIAEGLCILFAMFLIFMPKYYGHQEYDGEKQQLYYEQGTDGQLEYGAVIVETKDEQQNQGYAQATLPPPGEYVVPTGDALTYA